MMMESREIIQKVVQGAAGCRPLADSSWSAIHNLKRHAQSSQPGAFALAERLATARPVYLPESLGERLLSMLFAKHPIHAHALDRDVFWPWVERALHTASGSREAVGTAKLEMRENDVAALARRGLANGKLLTELLETAAPGLAAKLRSLRPIRQLPDADPALAVCYLHGDGLADAFLLLTLYGEWLAGDSSPEGKQVERIQACRETARRLATAETRGAFESSERVAESATPPPTRVPSAVAPPPQLGLDPKSTGAVSGLAAGWRRFTTLMTGWFRFGDDFYPCPVHEWFAAPASEALLDGIWQSWRAERWYRAAWIRFLCFLSQWHLPVSRWIPGWPLREGFARDRAVLLLLRNPPPPHRRLLGRLVRAIYHERRGYATILTRERVLNLLSRLDACRYPAELTLICLEACLTPSRGRVAGLRERLASLLDVEKKSRSARKLHAALQAACAALLDAEKRYPD